MKFIQTDLTEHTFICENEEDWKLLNLLYQDFGDDDRFLMNYQKQELTILT